MPIVTGAAGDEQSNSVLAGDTTIHAQAEVGGAEGAAELGVPAFDPAAVELGIGGQERITV